jgi:hypothetical protein
MWKLYLDDERDPEKGRNTPEGFVRAYSSIEAINLVKELGPPEFMSLDFDLGPYGFMTDDSLIFLKWLNQFLPKGSSPPNYFFHTKNPIGKLQMESYLESWKRSLNL